MKDEYLNVADAHTRRVTLNLAGLSEDVPVSIKKIAKRMVEAGWKWDALTKSDNDDIYGLMDEEVTEAVLSEWDVSTHTIRDWGFPRDRDGRLYDWAREAGNPGETHCKLCGHKHNRFEFLATNSVNGNTMWMGSTCIEKYKFTVDGNAVAEFALGSLRKAISKRKRMATCAEWQAEHPDHADRIATMRRVPRTHRNHRYYLHPWARALKKVGSDSWGFRRMVKQISKTLNATLRYYDKHGYLTEMRTENLYGGEMWVFASELLSIRDRAKRYYEDCQTEWEDFKIKNDARLTPQDRQWIQRKMDWADRPSDLTGHDKNRWAELLGRVTPTPSSAPTVATRRTPPPPTKPNYEEGNLSFAQRRSQQKSGLSDNPQVDLFADLPWNS